MASKSARVLFLAAALGGLACSQETAGPGTSSTLAVRVYVDADGSADFTPGDTPIADVVVTLASTASSGPSTTATTNAEGLAQFAAVAPGAYVATIAGTPPAGSVLATATAVSVTAPFEGGTLAAEFRFTNLPGAIQGVVFRDDNSNGIYDPGTDTPAAGVSVFLFEGTAVSADTLDGAQSGFDGSYSLTTLRPGTFTISVSSPYPTLDIVGDTIQTLTVEPDVTTSFDVEYTGQAIISIAQAKALPGQVVTVEAVVSVAQGTYRTQGDNMYIQDFSSGIQVFGVDPGLALALGDSVRVTGVMGSFGNEQQIVRIDASTPPIVDSLGTGTPITPRTVTAAEINAQTFEGELATIANALLPVAPTDSFGAYNLTFDVGGTTFNARIETGVAATVPWNSWTAGNTYTLTGALGSFFGTAQLKPRDVSDVASPITIADAKTMPGSVVTIEGVVTVEPGTFRTQGDNLYMQDATSGIQVFNVPSGLGIVLGDSIQVTGVMSDFGGEQQVVRFSASSPPVIVVLGTGTLPAPRVVTAAEIVARTFEGELVTISNALLPAVPTDSVGAYNMTFDVGGTAFNARIETGVAPSVPWNSWTAGNTYTLTGVLGSFFGSAQIKPRGAGDVTP